MITATIAAMHLQFPGFAFRLLGSPDGHHNQVRFSWELGPANEPAPIAGFDVATLNAAGQILAVFGFLDKVPTVA